MGEGYRLVVYRDADGVLIVNLRACQLLLGHTKLESTVRYLGIEVDDGFSFRSKRTCELWHGGLPPYPLSFGQRQSRVESEGSPRPTDPISMPHKWTSALRLRPIIAAKRLRVR